MNNTKSDHMNYESICTEVEAIARAAGQFIREERRKITPADVEIKEAVTSLVTYVDKTTEARIVEGLQKVLPGSGFITEEGTATHREERLLWIIDPLDGTTNFIHDLAPHSVSIALMEGDELVVGVIYEVGQDELFSAWKGGPALLNGRPIRTAQASRLEDGLIGTGFPYYDFERVDDYIAAMRQFMQSTRGLRRMGSAAVDLAYVAAGRFNGFFEHALHAWDVAAGAFIVQQAGGRVTDFNGGSNWLFGGQIVAAGTSFFDPFYLVVHEHLGN